ncbi:MAG: hypothetical protein OEW56_07835 [Gemmatimonadota bacterium]|nr:hypothetical protein [Gemmatimonadota bacterium]
MLAAGFAPTAKAQDGGVSANLVAYHQRADGSQLLAFDITVQLPGAVTAFVGDVVRWDGTAFSKVFDAAARGIPRGTAVDAVSERPSGHLLLSFDVPVSLGTTHVSPEDLVEWDGTSFSLVYDGSAAGIPAGTNLWAVHARPDGTLLLGFDATIALPGGVLARPDRVVSYAGGTYALVSDGATRGMTPGMAIDALAEQAGDLLVSLDVTLTAAGVTVRREDVARFGATMPSVELDGSRALAERGPEERSYWTLLISLLIVLGLLAIIGLLHFRKRWP